MEKSFISTKTVCSQYNIEISFVDELHNIGLIQIEIIEEDEVIHMDQLTDLEKMIRLHKDLNMNLEGIDVVFNLLEKQQQLNNELKDLQNKLKLYEEI